jgi:hypothetical protein
MSLSFEDRLTVQYEVQEMLRIERSFEPHAILAELEVYNPWIPDGHNLKATLLLEYPGPQLRSFGLERLRGIEQRICAMMAGQSPAFASADEDLDRSDQRKTSAVHFLRFEFTTKAITALRGGAALAFAVDDPRYPSRTDVGARVCEALLRDFA